MRQGQEDEGKGGRIRSTIRMLIPLKRQSEAIQILDSVREQIQFDPSCLSSRLYRCVDEIRAIMVEELWENGEEIRRHLRSDVYRRVLLVIEMAEEQPEIRFDAILSTTGFETIENARTQNTLKGKTDEKQTA